MARYIDLVMVEYLIDHFGGMVTWNKKEILREIKRHAQIHATTDVVPKSEVEKAVDDLKRYIILNENIAIKCKRENGEQNEEYWKGKLSAFLQIRGYIDVELKKKYPEDNR